MLTCPWGLRQLSSPTLLYKNVDLDLCKFLASQIRDKEMVRAHGQMFSRTELLTNLTFLRCGGFNEEQRRLCCLRSSGEMISCSHPTYSRYWRNHWWSELWFLQLPLLFTITPTLQTPQIRENIFSPRVFFKHLPHLFSIRGQEQKLYIHIKQKVLCNNKNPNPIIRI